MNHVKLLFLVTLPLLFMTPGAQSTLRHRYSFFHDADSVVAWEEAIEYTRNDTVNVKNFGGIREWKLIARVEELFQTVRHSKPPELDLWKPSWTARVQFASESFSQLPPFIMGPVPGVHVAVSLGHGNEDDSAGQSFDFKSKDFITVCKYLDSFFGIFICDESQSNFRGVKHGTIDLKKSISIRNFAYLHISRPFHHQLAILKSVVGEYLTRAESHEPAMFDFLISFNEKEAEPIIELRVVWRCQDHNIEVRKMEDVDERVEIGVFQPPLIPNTFIGVRTVIGKDDNMIAQTMIIHPSFVLNTTLYYYNSSITPSSSFHPTFQTTITTSSEYLQLPSCRTYIIHVLPESFFVDPYQLNELFSNRKVQVWGETDLEKPAGVNTLKWGSVVQILAKESEEDDTNVDAINISLPIHARYQPPVGAGIFESRSHITVAASWPVVVQQCEVNNDYEKKGPEFGRTPLPLSILFPANANTQLEYVLPSLEQDYLPWMYWPNERMNVPVGQLAQLKIVEWWTVLAVALGFVCVAWITVQKFTEVQYLMDKNKMD